jgi:hypothetical protein
LIAKEKNRAAGENAIVMPELRFLGGLAIYPRSITGSQVFQVKTVSISLNQEMAAGKRLIVNHNIG